mmetsp:Transcript_20076/g.41594  ORF Transcript_20076/g.41594 Transcript_20076/m.41594 type:complete len:240 (-) Transcript_20076:1074-1793(-)
MVLLLLLLLWRQHQGEAEGKGRSLPGRIVLGPDAAAHPVDEHLAEMQAEARSGGLADRAAPEGSFRWTVQACEAGKEPPRLVRIDPGSGIRHRNDQHGGAPRRRLLLPRRGRRRRRRRRRRVLPPGRTSDRGAESRKGVTHRRRTGSDGNRRAAVGVLDGVRDHVDEDLLEPQGVGVHECVRRVTVAVPNDVHAGDRCERVAKVDGVSDRIRGQQRCEKELVHHVRRGFFDVQEIVDQI